MVDGGESPEMVRGSLGTLRIEGLIGKGGMGAVYRAVGADGSPVALKVLLPQTGEAAEQHARRFAREARIRIDHPNVVRVIDAGVDGESPWIAFELLEGWSLRQRLRARGVLSVQEALDLAVQACRGLAAAHALGVVHRDVKPGNVFLCENGTVKLVDFGVARWSEVDPDLTADRRIVGTPSYLSPEQARGDADVDARADIWAIGLILYEGLTGKKPFSRKSTVGTMLAVVLEEPPPLELVRKGLPRSLVEVVNRCLTKDRDRRFASAAELLEALLTIDATEEAYEPLDLPITVDMPEETRATLDVRSQTRVMAEGEARVVAVLLAEGVRDAAAIERAVSERDGIFIPLLGRGRAIGLFGGEAWEGDEVIRAASAALVARDAAKWVSVAPGHAQAAGQAIAGDAVEAAEHGCAAKLAGVALAGDAGRLLRGGFDVREIGRGLAELTAARRPYWPLESQPEGAGPTVGRDAEVARMKQALDRVLGGHTAGLVVIGPSGIGKSRLRFEAERLIEELPTYVKVLSGRAEPLRREQAYALFRGVLEGRARLGSMLRGWPRIDSEAPEGERQEGVRVLVRDVIDDPRAAEEVASFIGDLVRVPMPETEALGAARRDPQLMADRLHMACADYLEAACERGPVALLLDDLQWADEQSLTVVEEIATLGDLPLWVVGTARPEVEDRFPGRFAHAPFERLVLGGLAREAIDTLATAIAGQHLAPELVSAVAERTSGNPLFVEQIVTELRERDLLDEPPGVLPLSLTIEAAVQSRLDQLPREEKELLKRAAVLARPFGAEDLAGLGVPDAATLLASLVRRDLLSGRSRLRRGQNREYRFRSTLIADVASRMLTDEVRMDLHRRAAEMLASRDNVEPEELARHYEGGGEPTLAAERYADAAIAAARRGDSHTVLRCSERALALAVPAARRFALHMARADALRFLGRRGDQMPELEAALGLAEGDRELAQVLIEHAVFASRTGDTPTALRAAQEAVDHARSCGDTELLAMARGRAAFALVIAGRHREAEAALAEAEAIAERASPRVRAFVSEFRGLLANALGDLGMQVEAYGEAVRQYEAVGDVRRAAGAEGNVADAYNRVGAYSEAEVALRATVEKCRRVGNHLVEAYAMVNLGYALAMQDRHEEATAVIEEARRRAQITRDVRLDLFARVYLTRTRLSVARERGDASRVVVALVAEADSAAEEASRLGLPSIRALALSLAARGLLDLGDSARALDRSSEALRIRDELGSLEEDEGGVFLTHVRALTAAGRATEAVEVRARGSARLDELAGRIGSDAWRERFRRDVAAHRKLLAP